MEYVTVNRFFIIISSSVRLGEITLPSRSLFPPLAMWVGDERVNDRVRLARGQRHNGIRFRTRTSNRPNSRDAGTTTSLWWTARSTLRCPATARWRTRSSRLAACRPRRWSRNGPGRWWSAARGPRPCWTRCAWSCSPNFRCRQTPPAACRPTGGHWPWGTLSIAKDRVLRGTIPVIN